MRGLREFDWRGFRCAVTAPKLNGAIVTNLDIAPVLIDAEADDSDAYLDIEQVAGRLADAEDRLAA